jgi:hypothetical protein
MAMSYLIPSGTSITVAEGAVTLAFVDSEESVFDPPAVGGTCRGGCRGVIRSLANEVNCQDDIYSMCFIPKLDTRQSLEVGLATLVIITSANPGDSATLNLVHDDAKRTGTLEIPAAEG